MVATSQSLCWQQLLGLAHPRGRPGKRGPSFPAHPSASRDCAQGRSRVGRRQHVAAPNTSSCCHPCTKCRQSERCVAVLHCRLGTLGMWRARKELALGLWQAALGYRKSGTEID